MSTFALLYQLMITKNSTCMDILVGFYESTLFLNWILGM